MRLRTVSRWIVIALVIIVALIAIIYQAFATHANSPQKAPAHATPTFTSGSALHGVTPPIVYL